LKLHSKVPPLVTFAQPAESDSEQAERIASYIIDDSKAEEQLINNYIIDGEAVYSKIIEADPKFNLKAYLLNKNSNITNAEALLYYLGS